jgi:two-component system sensor histidine kinase DegS
MVERQESERRYISRTLHDESGQMLTSVMVNLQLLERNAGRPDYVIAKCAEIAAGVQGVLKDLQRLAVTLRPATLDHLGLAPALRQLANHLMESHPIRIQFETVGIHRRLPVDVETALFRIAQEATTAILHEANARQISILLQSRNRRLVMVIEDDGVGFDLKTRPPKDLLGLIGIRERVEMIGGEITIESSPGKGATLVVELPDDYQNSDR